MHIVVISGERVSESDGVADFVENLTLALPTVGVGSSLMFLRRECDLRVTCKLVRESLRDVEDARILLQHTHLMWSRHGTPRRALKLASLLSDVAPTHVYIHDPVPFTGLRSRYGLLSILQSYGLRKLESSCDGVLVTINPKVLPWARGTQARFCPAGSNVPLTSELLPASERAKTVVLFGAGNVSQTVETIADAFDVARGALRGWTVEAIGAESDSLGWLLQRIRPHLDVSWSGHTTTSELSTRLGSAAILLDVRRPVSSRRGTVVAGLQHGLTIVGYSSPETAWPITAGGVVLAGSPDGSQIGEKLATVLASPELRTELSARSLTAYTDNFSWNVIAKRVVDAFA